VEPRCFFFFSFRCVVVSDVLPLDAEARFLLVSLCWQGAVLTSLSVPEVVTSSPPLPPPRLCLADCRCTVEIAYIFFFVFSSTSPHGLPLSVCCGADTPQSTGFFLTHQQIACAQASPYGSTSMRGMTFPLLPSGLAPLREELLSPSRSKTLPPTLRRPGELVESCFSKILSLSHLSLLSSFSEMFPFVISKIR